MPDRSGRFLVHVQLRSGRIREIPAATPAQARRIVAELSLRAAVQHISWMPHPQLPMPVALSGRYVAGIPGIGDAKRVAHLFLLKPGVQIGPAEALTAWCGEPIRFDQLDILRPGDGTPCYRCRAELPHP